MKKSEEKSKSLVGEDREKSTAIAEASASNRIARREFLRRGGAFALMALIIPASLAPPKAMQDDTDMLQRMLDCGEPIVGGTYHVSRTLHFTKDSYMSHTRMFSTASPMAYLEAGMMTHTWWSNPTPRWKQFLTQRRINRTALKSSLFWHHGRS